MELTLSVSNVKGSRGNTRYGERRVIRSREELLDAVQQDHVCGVFENNRRSIDGFLEADVLMLDCDNEQSEEPADWITLERAAEIFSEFNFALVPSRSHLKKKRKKTARPRWHIYFSITKLKNAEAYAALKRRIQEAYPFFDPGALDAARMIFGSDPADVIWHEGGTNVDEVFVPEKMENTVREPAGRRWEREEDLTEEDAIPNGQRNDTLHRIAVKEFRRTGDEAQVWAVMMIRNKKCEPPLEESELRQIWESAARWYEKIRKEEEEQYMELLTGNLENEQEKKEETEKKECVEMKKEITENITSDQTEDGESAIIPIAKKRAAKPAPRKKSVAAASQGKFLPEDYSDLGQAKVLEKNCGKILCYSDSTGYMKYDGKVWQEGKQFGKALVEKFLDRQLKEAEEMYKEARGKLLKAGVSKDAIDAGGKALKDEAKKRRLHKLLREFEKAEEYRTYISRHRNNKNVSDVAEAAKPMLLFDPRELDHDPFQLNTPDGTYDLREGVNSKKEHDPDDKITKMTACSPGDEGKQLWEDALDKFFCGNAELITYVQKVIGLAAIGKVFNEHIIIAYGGGANGKSTFCNAVARTLGSYSRRMAADLLTTSAARNARPELAELRGARLVLASELEEGKRMNTATLKQLASTDDISAEKKYRDPMNFTPSHSLILQTNHLPKVGANDDGTWRRIIVIPFNAQIQGSDDIKNYSDYLVEHAGAYILKWIMEGAKNVIDAGFDIPVPDCVKAATDAYREENDWMKHFLEECCEMDPSYTEQSGALYQSYRAYSDQVGEYTRNKGDFYAALEKAGFERKRTSAGVVVYGLKLKNNTGFLG